MSFKVRNRRCKTCIYRNNSALDIKRLEKEIADPSMSGFFETFRACHDVYPDTDLCCRGFWNRHKDDFQLGQLAQRLDAVEFVE